jgi:hypothetical protein
MDQTQHNFDELSAAVRAGNLAEVERLLAEGATLDAEDDDGKTVRSPCPHTPRTPAHPEVHHTQTPGCSPMRLSQDRSISHRLGPPSLTVPCLPC